MPQGTVKWFNERKGFGFIENKDGDDVFVHFTQIQDQTSRKLKQGDTVEYEIVPGEIGPRAARVIKKPPLAPTN